MALPSVAESQGLSRAEQARAGKVARAERRRKVMALAASGASVESIAEVLDMSPRGVSSIITRQLNRMQDSTAADTEVVRAKQLDRLDRMLLAIWSKVEEGNLKAIDRALRIEQQRARITGAEKPQRHEHEHSGTVSHELADPEEVKRLQEAFETAHSNVVDGEAVDVTDERPGLPEASAA